jgi:hypothetical protein
MISVIAGKHLPQPFPLLRDRMMHAPLQFSLDLFQLCPSAIPPALAVDLEPTVPVLSADVGKS